MSIAKLEDVANIGRALTDAEKAYLHARSRDHDIEQNERIHGNKTKVGDLPLFADALEELQPVAGDTDDPASPDFSKFDKALVEEVTGLDYGALQAECKLHDVPATGKKEDLQLALLKAVSEQEKKEA
jgi:hypothetical protein